MSYQSIFKRYELKYMLTDEQRMNVMRKIEPYMALDEYGRTTIRNIYFDTSNYRLIRHSIESPVYKEKLRVRSYSRASKDSTVFVELKKKYRHVVYKRRTAMSEKEALEWISGKRHCSLECQICSEIDYFLKYYGDLSSKVFLSYEREAYFAKDGSDFRITFDDNILCRQNDLSLESSAYGTPILPQGRTLMEIKCSGGMPLWMTHILSEEKIYKTSYSKYGTAYKTLIYPHEKYKKQEAINCDGYIFQGAV